MSANFLLYIFCLLANTPILLTAGKVRSNKPQIESPSFYESLEILPLISSRLADTTNIMTEKIDEHDKDKLLTLFTDTKKEVDEKMLWLNKLHGYFKATCDAMFNAAIISEAETTTPKREDLGIIQKKVKDAEAFVTVMMRVLRNFFVTPQQVYGKQTSKTKQMNGQNIAWSYYDDIGK